MNHRAFMLLSASALRLLEDQRRAALQDWAGDWLAAGSPTPALQARRLDAPTQATSMAGAPGHLLGDATHRFVWVSGADARVLAGWLFPGLRSGGYEGDEDKGDERNGEVLEAVCRTALDHLMRLMLGLRPAPDQGVGQTAEQAQTAQAQAQASESTPSALPPHGLRPGAALAALRIALGDTAICMVHAGNLPSPPRTTEPARRPCEPLDAALAQQLVTLRADLGHIDMDLGALYGLHKGDVIRLSARLDAPLALRVEGHDGPAPAKGYLGAIDRHRALEIVAEP